MSEKRGLEVAVVGAGITGLTLALGLQARGVRFTVYERAAALHEVGAGIGISPNAERALEAIDPAALAAFRRVAMPNGEDYFQWLDGHGSGELAYRLWVGEGGFQGCRRADLVEELARAVPPERLRFGKEAEDVMEEGGRVTLRFADGSTATADVVVGCDGIRSRVRPALLGADNPASCAGYSGKFCFRALVPMDVARSTVGGRWVSTRFMYTGPGAHVISYPVADGALLNVLVVVSDQDIDASWLPTDGTLTAPGTSDEAVAAFRDWHPTTRAVVGLLPPTLDKWALFDTLDHPAPKYARGAVCLAGDAAHAAGPHLGAGGAFGIEDALALSSVLAVADAEAKKGLATAGKEAAAALAAYNDVRYERTQWLVKETRAACALFHWEDGECDGDWERFGREITWRFHKIWDYDVAGMVRELEDRFRDMVKA